MNYKEMRKYTYENMYNNNKDETIKTLIMFDDINNKLMTKNKLLKDTINKAIEYINKYCIDDEFYINLTNKEKCIIDVLRLLEETSE